MHASIPSIAKSARSRGTMVVAIMLAAALGLAAFAVWFQWRQTRRCLDFYGGDVARLVQTAPRVELWRLAPAAEPSSPEPRERIDRRGALSYSAIRCKHVRDDECRGEHGDETFA